MFVPLLVAVQLGAQAGASPDPPPAAPVTSEAPAQIRTGPNRRAQPRSPLESWFSNDDYPAAAQRAGQQGRVDYRLRIGADGRVEDCTVTRSSRSPALDSATCRILQRRSQFLPATDSAGRPTTGFFIGHRRWRSSGAPVVRASPVVPVDGPVRPEDYPAEAVHLRQQGDVEYVADINEVGRISWCAAVATNTSPALTLQTCVVLQRSATYLPARDANGNATRDRTRAIFHWRLPEERRHRR